MTGEAGSESEFKRVPASGNLVISRIAIHPKEGLVIMWARPDIIPTMIDESGIEKPLYDFVIKKFPDIKNVAGKDLYIVSTSSGLPVEIGPVGGGEHVSIEKELREKGLLD